MRLRLSAPSCSTWQHRGTTSSWDFKPQPTRLGDPGERRLLVPHPHPRWDQPRREIGVWLRAGFLALSLFPLQAGELHGAGTFRLCLPERLLPRSQMGKCCAAWIYWREANPTSSVTSACLTPGRRRSTYPLPRFVSTTTMGDCLDQPCQVPDTSAGNMCVKGKESVSEQRHSKC